MNDVLRMARDSLTYDSETGLFQWRFCGNGRKLGQPAGSVMKKGYRHIGLGRRYYKAHRLAWLMTFGEWPAGEIDHMNGNRDDNRLANLRDVSHTENMQNLASAMRNSLTGRLGVCLDKESATFRARIIVNGKRHDLGRFASLDEASNAYNAAKAVRHKCFRGVFAPDVAVTVSAQEPTCAADHVLAIAASRELIK